MTEIVPSCTSVVMDKAALGHVWGLQVQNQVRERVAFLNLTVWPVDWLRVSGEPSDILVSSVQSGQSPKEKLSI